MELKIDNLSETAVKRLGIAIGKLCEPGDVVCLSGNLGSGKTTFTQALAHGAGVDPGEYVCSPSFALLHEYKGSIPIYHMDFYRLQDDQDIIEMGLDEYFSESGITVIEWSQKAESVLPSTRLKIEFIATSPGERSVVFSCYSSPWNEKLSALSEGDCAELFNLSP